MKTDINKFKALEPEDVLIEYDAPIVFLLHDCAGQLHLAYLADSQKDATVYLVTTITESQAERIASGTDAVRSAFIDNGFVVVVRKGGTISSIDEEKLGTISPRYLPSNTLRVFASV